MVIRDESYYLNLELQAVRDDRNLLLLQSDWTQFTDSPLPQSKKEEFAEYRQQLRDITEPFKGTTYTFTLDSERHLPSITWPVKPEL